MAFGCPICSEKLDNSPAVRDANRAAALGQEVNISATPCGHIFHSYCIQKWLTGNLASSKKCPCCRKDVPRLRCLSLFPNSFDETILDESISEGRGGEGSSASCRDHETKIKSLEAKLEHQEKLYNKLEQMHQLLCEDYNDARERLDREKLTSDTWMMKAKQYESYRDLATELEERALKAEKRLKTYMQMECMLKGYETNVEEEMSNFPPTKDSIKTLIECKQVLSRELKNASKKAEDAKRRLDENRSEQLKLKVSYENKCRELKELKHIYEISRVNGRVRDSSPMVGPSSSAVGGATPKVFRMKRRLQEPVAASSSSTLLKSNDPNVDSDIEIFQPQMHKKAKSTRPNQPSSQLFKKKDGLNNLNKESKFPSCTISPIVPEPKKKSSSSNSTIDLASSDNDEDEDDLKIRGNVPGAPLPIAAKRIKALQQKSSRPVLGKTSPATIPIRKFTFKKRLT